MYIVYQILKEKKGKEQYKSVKENHKKNPEHLLVSDINSAKNKKERERNKQC